MSAATSPHRQPPKVRRPEPAPRARDTLIERLEARVLEPGADAGSEVAAFLRAHPANPIITVDADEPAQRIVTFAVVAPNARAVLLFANRITDETDLAASELERVAGTDLWHISYRMSADWQASYSLQIAGPGSVPAWRATTDHRELRRLLDHGTADARNPVHITNRAGVAMSLVRLDEAPEQRWWARRPGTADGELTEASGPDGRRLWCYEPAAAAWGERDRSAPAPLVIVLDGDVWAGVQWLPATFDNLTADGLMPPIRAVFIDSADRDRRWNELDEHGGLVDWAADRLRPWLAANLPGPVDTDPARTAVIGQSLGGLTALAAVIRRPEALGVAISQSAALWQPQIADEARARPPRHARIDVQVGRQEWVLREPNRAFAAQLAADGVDARLSEYNGGHDYAWWRGGIADGLVRTRFGA